MVSFDPRVSFSSASIVATPCFLRNAIITGVTNIRDLAIVERFERFASLFSLMLFYRFIAMQSYQFERKNRRS